MDWSYLPILLVTAIGLVGFCLIMTAFVMIFLQGGWKQAMQLGSKGKWTLPRRLMAVGAGLGVLFGVLFVLLYLIPGGIPWRH